jgi:Tfp pilus assembly protein PilE
MTGDLGIRIPFLVARSDRTGPTLVELAVAVTVAALLGTIAVRPYLAYRARAYDLYVEAAVRNAATAQQARLADGQDYLSGDCSALAGYAAAPGVRCVARADATGFTITASHRDARHTCTWTTAREPGRPSLACA